MSEALSLLAKELAAKLGPELLAYFKQEHLLEHDDLLTVRQVAKRLKLGETSVRNLVKSGALHCAPDIKEIRIRQSVVDSYGTQPKAAKR